MNLIISLPKRKIKKFKGKTWFIALHFFLPDLTVIHMPLLTLTLIIHLLGFFLHSLQKLPSDITSEERFRNTDLFSNVWKVEAAKTCSG